MVDLTFLAAVPLDGFAPERANRFRAKATCCSIASAPIGLILPEGLPLCHRTAPGSGCELLNRPPPLPRLIRAGRMARDGGIILALSHQNASTNRPQGADFVCGAASRAG